MSRSTFNGHHRDDEVQHLGSPIRVFQMEDHLINTDADEVDDFSIITVGGIWVDKHNSLAIAEKGVAAVVLKNFVPFHDQIFGRF